MSEELKPCPFCGGEASVDLYHADDWQVTCIGSYSCHGWRVFEDNAGYDSPEEAIKAWNTRSNDE